MVNTTQKQMNVSTTTININELYALREDVLQSIANLGDYTGGENQYGYTVYDCLMDELDYYEEEIEKLEALK